MPPRFKSEFNQSDASNTVAKTKPSDITIVDAALALGGAIVVDETHTPPSQTLDAAEQALSTHGQPTLPPPLAHGFTLTHTSSVHVVP